MQGLYKQQSVDAWLRTDFELNLSSASFH